MTQISVFFHSTTEETLKPLERAKDVSDGVHSERPRQIEKHISELKKKGIIERVGARKNGMWPINAE